MDNKKFDEIMHKYVSGKTRGMNADFGKLNEMKEKKNVKKYKGRLVWATVSCFVVMAITLSIVLPLTLPSARKGDDSQLSNIQYFEEHDLAFQIVESKDELSAKYNITAKLPTIQYQDAGYCVILGRVNESVIGALIEITIFDKYFDYIKIHIISENKVLNTLVAYDTLPYESKWENSNIKYTIEYDEEWDCNNIMLFFVLDGYKYYLDAQYYGDLNVEEVLDLIF